MPKPTIPKPGSMPKIFIPSIKSPDAAKRKQGLFHNLLWLLFGALLGLSAPGFGFWPLAWVGLIPLFYGLSQARSQADALKLGVLFGAGYHYTYLCWYLGLYPMAWMGFNPWQSLGVALGAWSLASLYGALFIGLLAVGFWHSLRVLPKTLCILGFPLLWIITFWAFKQTDFGVPWALLEYTQSSLPWMRSLARFSGQWLGDSSLITYLILLHNLAFTFLLKQNKTVRFGLLLLLVPFGLWISNAFPPAVSPVKLPLPVVLIQGNLPIEVVRSPEALRLAAAQAYRDPLLHLSLQPETLVVLPEEGAVPGWVSLQEPLRNTALLQLAQVAWRRQVSLITGVSSYDPNTRNTYNSLVFVPSRPGLLQFYHKRRLVPFGEYTPYVNASWLSQQFHAMGISYDTAFQRGRGTVPFQISAEAHHPALKLGNLICFELIYPELAQEYRRQNAKLLVNTSNLGWFHGNHWLEEQFLAIGQLRAAETGLPLVIATNSGVSAIISSEGEIQQRSLSQHTAVLGF